MPKKLHHTVTDQAKLDSLFAEYAAATKRAIEALRIGDDERHREEDRKAGECVRQIKEIQGTTGKPWNAS